MTWGFAGRAGSRHGPVLNVLLLQETSGNSQSTSTRETGAKNGNWDSGIAANTGRAAARRHRAARGALPVDHRHGVRRRDRGIDPGASEIAVFLVLGVFFVVHAGSHNTLSVFGTGHTRVRGRGAARGGDPRPAADRAAAVLLATLGIGILYVFTAYAASVAFGPDKFKMPRRYLPTAAFGGVHDQLRELATSL